MAKIDRMALEQKINALDLDNESKSQLLELLRERKKYGIVWEEHPEDIEERLREDLPVLVEDKDKAIISEDKDAPNHILIEGDNLEALTALSYTHDGKIDVIYIDPPYNTGAKSWKYNNDYVDSQDQFKHSKWISMMNRRVKIAKRLLSDAGILVVTIDDYEIENLTLLMNEVFGEDNHLGTIVIKNNPSGRSTTSGFSIAHEYALFYCKNINMAHIGRLDRESEQINRYKEKDEYGRFEWVNFRARYSTISPTLQYPIFIKKDGTGFRLPNMQYINGAYQLYETPLEDEIVRYPIDAFGKMRCWKWGIETLLQKKSTEISIRQDQNKEYTLYAKSRLTEEGMLPLTWWDKSEYSSTSMGNNLLATILGGKKFDYPKSLYAVIDCLKVANATSYSTILDFFAGSGTTLHATMQLNAEDGGHRQCILVTNNENNICEEVTYERNKRVIKGYTTPKGEAIEGLHSNTLRYYRTDFVARENTLQNRRKLVYLATDMLCIKEDCYNEQPCVGKAAKAFMNGNKQLIIVYNPDYIPEVVEYIKQQSTTIPIKVYVFADGQYPYTDDFEEVAERVELCAIPSAILNAMRKVLPKKKTILLDDMVPDKAMQDDIDSTLENTSVNDYKSEEL